MKNTTKILATFVATAIIASLTLTTFAMWNGNGQWKGQWQGQGQWMWNWQGQGKWKGQSWNNTKTHSPADMLVWVATWTLSEEEKNNLLYQYSEEMLARDLYNHFYELYWVQTFQNIANSESEHMQAVKVLLDRYSLQAPTWYGELQDEFDTLKVEWEISLKNALEVWVKAEILDITDIFDTIKSTDNDDIKIVFTNIWGASYNHMRWFLKWLTNAWFTTTIDYSKYLNQEQVDSKWTLKYLLAEKLVAEGVNLPTQANSESIKANCEKEEVNKQKWNWNLQVNSYGKNLSDDRKMKMQETKNKYKEYISNKYLESLQKMSENKLNTLSQKIDEAMTKISQDTNLTDTIKDKYMAIYGSLKEIVDSINLN